MAVKVAMPKLGLVMIEGVVVKWIVQDGKPVKKGDRVRDHEQEDHLWKLLRQPTGFYATWQKSKRLFRLPWRLLISPPKVSYSGGSRYCRRSRCLAFVDVEVESCDAVRSVAWCSPRRGAWPTELLVDAHARCRHQRRCVFAEEGSPAGSAGFLDGEEAGGRARIRPVAHYRQRIGRTHHRRRRPGLPGGAEETCGCGW